MGRRLRNVGGLEVLESAPGRSLGMDTGWTVCLAKLTFPADIGWADKPKLKAKMTSG